MNTSIYGHSPCSVAFILTPGFAFTSFALTLEALTVANEQSNGQCYEYHLYSGDPDKSKRNVTSSNYVPIEVEGHFSECDTASHVIVCAHKGASTYDDSWLLSKLRSLRKSGTQIAALSGGSFILARAGLLDGQTCTLFRDQLPLFKELYPHIGIQENIYTVNKQIYTCAGGMTALDMMLYIIGKDHGPDLAKDVANQFCYDSIRSPEEMQNTRRYLELRMLSPTLGAAIEIMESNIEHPYSIQQVAEKVGTTPRTLEHVFKTHKGTTPVNYYLQLRIDTAKKMIEETRLPLNTVAQATGFTSQSYFTKRFRERYKIAPGQLRGILASQ